MTVEKLFKDVIEDAGNLVFSRNKKIADLEKKVVDEAIVLDSNFLLKFLKNLSHNEVNPQLIIGNGTGSKKFINILSLK